jgi:hypothetical protein
MTKGAAAVSDVQFMQAAMAGRILERAPSTARYYGDTGRLAVVRTLDGVRLFKLEDVLRLKAELAAGTAVGSTAQEKEPVSTR